MSTAPRTERHAHAALLDAAAQHRRAHRIAPAPTGSCEIPGWLLAVLLGLAIAVVVSIGPGTPLFDTLLAATPR